MSVSVEGYGQRRHDDLEGVVRAEEAIKRPDPFCGSNASLVLHAGLRSSEVTHLKTADVELEPAG